MSEPPANSNALPPPTESWLTEPKPRDERWTDRQFVFVLVFVFTLHVALIFLFGTKKQIVPLPGGAVPHWQLADPANELVALSDPTLFARPNAHDVVSAFWRERPRLPRHNSDWPAPTNYLEPSPGNFGAVFHEFVKNSRPAEFPLDFKLAPIPSAPDLPFDNPVPQETTMKISEELARRPLLETVPLPSWPRNDVIGPSIIQVLVDTAGTVASTVVLQTSRDNDADQKAMQEARNLRFAPAPQPTIGEVTFYWHTVSTNAPAQLIP
ncbi:MAG TPA: energy transducer TonB [Candidatus Acidoferrales bacterium]|nr:energy transducer TonB [Candidatus Acidoferrales bacterium]